MENSSSEVKRKPKRKIEWDLDENKDTTTPKKNNTKVSYELAAHKILYYDPSRSNEFYDHWEFSIKELQDLFGLGIISNLPLLPLQYNIQSLPKKGLVLDF